MTIETIRKRRLKAMLALALAAVGSIHTPVVCAGMPVIDYVAASNYIKSHFEQFERWTATTRHYAETVRHYQETVQHYIDQAMFWETQLNKLRHLNFALFATKNHFSRIDDDFGVDIECPNRALSSGIAGILDKAISELLPSMDGDVVGQQRELCAAIVRTKNAKYNETVRYLDYIRDKSTELASAQTQGSALGSGSGNTQGYIAQINEFGETMEAARIQWETHQRQLDVHIEMMLTMQSHLARRAMNGKPSLAGAVINASALAAAFH